MNSLTKKIITIFLFSFCTFQLQAQIFNNTQLLQLKDSVSSFLNKYQEYADLTGDGVAINEEFKTKFTDLFTDSNSAKLHNCLGFGSKYISANDYIRIVTENYPKGLEVRLETDSLLLKNAKQLSFQNYSIIAICNEYTVGLDKSGVIKREDITAYFEIEFQYIDSAFLNLKIVEVKSEKTILKEQSNKAMKGLFLGINITPKLSQYTFSGDANQNYINSFSPRFSYGIGAEISYFLNTNIGIVLGVDYSKIQSFSNVSFNNESNNNLLRTDIDQDNFYLYINSDIEELTTIKLLNFPLKITYRFNLYNKTSFFVSGGIYVSYVLSSNYFVNGNSIQNGYYPEYHLFVDEAANYNFGEINYNNEFDFELNKLNFFANFDFGISIPLGSKSYLNASAEFLRTLNNLHYTRAVYRDDFIGINNIETSPIIQSAGLNISYIFKL